MDGDHPPFSPAFAVGHQLSCPEDAHRTILGLERDHHVSPDVSGIADDAVLKIEWSDRQVLRRAEKPLEILSERGFSFHGKRGERVEPHRLFMDKRGPRVEITLVQGRDEFLGGGFQVVGLGTVDDHGAAQRC